MIRVEKVLGLATVQDLGRVGHAPLAVPRGGALSHRWLRRANGALGNAPGAACLEVIGRLALRAETEVGVATEQGDVTVLRAGDDFVVEPLPGARVRYVAVAGGIDAPRILGSRSALVGCWGVVLRAGDRLVAANEAGARVAEARGDGRTIQVLRGPDDDGAAFDALLAMSWRVDTASDRRGTRLAGSKLAVGEREDLPSSPTVIGAIQLPAGGAPIVIGPDGPTTGGYPIIAVVARVDLDAFHELPLGAPVMFGC